jgi:lysophospholipase L1-like esterase
MKLISLILFFVTGSNACQKNNSQTMSSAPATTINKKYTYLALGDSYTIGEMVAAAENFPNQTVTILNNSSLNFQPARIIARTGWTTDELETGIITANATDPLLPAYNFVSLLIGVNNQYRGQSVDNYKPEFEELLKKAIHFAGGKTDHVIVLSIPDWGVTPFAEGRERKKIAMEINAYNEANKLIAKKYKVHYIDITPGTREAANDASLLTRDGLHPSGKAYKKWSDESAALIKSRL